MRIQSRNSRAKFHPDPIWNDVRSLGPFLVAVRSPQQEQEEAEEHDE